MDSNGSAPPPTEKNLNIDVGAELPEPCGNNSSSDHALGFIVSEAGGGLGEVLLDVSRFF